MSLSNVLAPLILAETGVVLICTHPCVRLCVNRNSRSVTEGGWRILLSHQPAIRPGAPLGQHAVIRTRQPALTCTCGNLLWVTQVILHHVSGAVDGVQHAPVTVHSQSFLILCAVKRKINNLPYD